MTDLTSDFEAAVRSLSSPQDAAKGRRPAPHALPPPGQSPSVARAAKAFSLQAGELRARLSSIEAFLARTGEAYARVGPLLWSDDPGALSDEDRDLIDHQLAQQVHEASALLDALRKSAASSASSIKSASKTVSASSAGGTSASEGSAGWPGDLGPPAVGSGAGAAGHQGAVVVGLLARLSALSRTMAELQALRFEATVDRDAPLAAWLALAPAKAGGLFGSAADGDGAGGSGAATRDRAIPRKGFLTSPGTPLRTRPLPPAATLGPFSTLSAPPDSPPPPSPATTTPARRRHRGPPRILLRAVAGNCSGSDARAAAGLVACRGAVGDEDLAYALLLAATATALEAAAAGGGGGGDDGVGCIAALKASPVLGSKARRALAEHEGESCAEAEAAALVAALRGPHWVADWQDLKAAMGRPGGRGERQGGEHQGGVPRGKPSGWERGGGRGKGVAAGSDDDDDDEGEEVLECEVEDYNDGDGSRDEGEDLEDVMDSELLCAMCPEATWHHFGLGRSQAAAEAWHRLAPAPEEAADADGGGVSGGAGAVGALGARAAGGLSGCRSDRSPPLLPSPPQPPSGDRGSEQKGGQRGERAATAVEDYDDGQASQGAFGRGSEAAALEAVLEAENQALMG